MVDGGMFLKAAMLNVSGGDNALADSGGIFAGLLAGHFFERNEGNFDVHVDAIQQGAGDFAEVTLDFPRGTLGFGGHFAVGRGVHGGYEHEVGRECGGADGARDGDAAFFQRLPHSFENAAFEFWQFVEEEHSVVGDGDFAGDGVGAAAEEPGIAGGVVRGAEWALGNQRLVVGEESRTLWILVVSRASSRVRGGRMVESRLANIDFPVPGGPIKRMLWPPAAATSRARLTDSWPRTSAKSDSSVGEFWVSSAKFI